MRKYILSVTLHLFLIVQGNAQTPFISESLIKYDLSTHKADKTIPFDHAFTLVLEKFKTIKVTNVHIYEADIHDNKRLLVENILPKASSIDRGCCKTYKGQKLKDTLLTHAAILDKELRFKADTSGLQIFIDPLKPNKIFDINVIGLLSTVNKSTIYQINSLLSIGNISKAQTQFDALDKALTDPFIFRSYLTLNFASYQSFYFQKLKTAYDFIADESNFPVVSFISLEDLQAIDISLKSEKQIYKNSHFLVEVIQNNYEKDVQRGIIDIAQAFNQKTKTAMNLGHIRISYLESSLKILDSLHQKTDWLIDKGYNVVMVDGNAITLELVRQKLKYLRDNMDNSLTLLSERMKNVSEEIDMNDKIRQGVYLAGQTISSDLKSAGGSILFIDAGFTNIIAPGLKDSRVYIPRLYYGASIYFRPIDKNTRRGSFPRKYPSDKNCACSTDEKCGPDYGVISKSTIWQHLCLNIGLTLGSIPNKDFDNFYNNTSLLIGPAYRFKRAFKVSAGIALLKRSSENPIISEKQVVVGGYIGISSDVDFIQSIKDITSILFK